jgi:hypothetical protein
MLKQGCKIHPFRLYAVMLGIVLLCSSVYAEPSGGIAGTARDTTGAAIANAKVTLVRSSTSATYTTTTDEQGAFQFIQMAPDVYRLTIEAQGFKRYTIKALQVLVDTNTSTTAVLEVGDVAETVTVDSSQPMVESQQNTLSGVVESKTIINMPLNARNFLDLALQTPGVTPSAAGNQVTGFNVAGARTQSNNFLIDGISNVDTQTNAGISNFRINDAVQEFSVQTSVPTAEFGRGQGAVVNAVTRSGSNALRGTAFEYFRNTVLDDTDYFTKKANTAKAIVNRNQFGGTLGGPIWKNKTFFFGSYEGFRQVAPTVTSTWVPNKAQRDSVTDPISLRLLQFWPTAQTTSTSGTNYTSNVPSSLKDSTGLLRVDHALSEKDSFDGHYIIYRGNQIVGGPTPLSGGYTNIPASTSTEVEENHIFNPAFLNVIRFGYSMNATTATVHDYGFNAASIFTDANGNPLPGVVNATGNNMFDSGLPSITISDGTAALGTSSTYPQGRISRTYELSDTMTSTAIHGHVIKWGEHVRREDLRRYLETSSRGLLTFQNFSDFAQGLVYTSQLRTGSTLVHYRRYPSDFFLQDQWKVLPNLTVNYGIRYELPSDIFELNDRGDNLVPGQGMTLFGTDLVLGINTALTGASSLTYTPGTAGVTDSGVLPDRNNVAPVVGFAYSPDFLGTGKTVIRGGFRVGYDEIFNNIPANQSLDAPVSLPTSQTANVTQPGKFSYATAFSQNVPLVSNIGKQGPGTPTVGLLQFYAMTQHLPSSYNYAYNLSVERELSKTFSAEADYIGSVGRKLGVYVDTNEPTVTANKPSVRGPLAPNEQVFPYNQYGQIYTGEGIGKSSYNGVVAVAKYRGQQGIAVQSSYTLSHSLDNTSAYFGSTTDSLPANPRDLSSEYGNSGFDLRQRWDTYYVVPIPMGPGHKLLGQNSSVSRLVASGWEVSGIIVAQTGLPFTTHLGSVDYSGFNQFTDRPNVIGTGKLKQSNGTPAAAFDTTYFSKSIAANTVGTERRNQYYGPHLVDFDMSAAKTFALRDRYRFQFRADFFNLFNHTNFANPVATVSSSSFGKITSTIAGASSTSGGTTGGARLIQFSGRLSF